MPPVSSPSKTDQERDNVVLVEVVKVKRPGRVGAMPGVVDVYAV